MCAVEKDKNTKDISVLYVGYSPDKPLPKEMPVRDEDKTEYIERLKVRMGSYETLLKKHFNHVKTIDGSDYNEALSDDYDVTIFDGMPTAIKEEKRVYNDNNELIEWEFPEYLSKDYDRATITIGICSPQIGQSLGLKNDWLCLCLEFDAHHIRVEHDIFNTPFKVDLTFESKDTPNYIYHYPSGKNVPKQIPMWRVLAPSYNNSALIPGMVSRGNGYEDSPDTEYISSGVCVKDVGAVALGRHANFFHWGFNGAADDFTEEAQLVFINSIVYINQFNGQKPIARKYNDRIQIREVSIAYSLRDVSEESYKKSVQEYERYNAKEIQRRAELIAKQKKGDKLTAPQKFFLTKNKGVLPTLEEYLKNKMGDDFTIFGTDMEAYRKFLLENKAYYYCHGSILNYKFELDKDAQQLGIANNDLKILEESIALLNNTDKKEVAQRILLRYTEQHFTTQKEWENWFQSNKEKLFFTESGGYKWLVNTIK
ncbi:hypothetical protein BZG02_07810 [Labilibaculum filiforme]|uniref:Uncharacterized protein n=2 Tax=Labilibaculum filiforme TaxID=1940526 RepID=A0A2N3I0W6_9BACT|nr:hypothetical protein BZG02_07810 [Labilibaculum filiforme]